MLRCGMSAVAEDEPKTKRHKSSDDDAGAKGKTVQEPPFELDDEPGRRRVSVNVFKGQVLLDIREFYSKDGDLKPGKKGISLTIDQWETMKTLIDSIDDALLRESAGKKK